MAALSLFAAGLLFSSTPAAADTVPLSSDVPSTVGADPLPTTQMNGVALTVTVKNKVVYVGGQFTRARPAGAKLGQQEVVRSNFLAYDVTNGELLPFAPSFNGQVRDLAVSPDGKTLYVSGQFTQVNGINRYRTAAFDLTTNQLLPWQPSVNGTVEAIVATSTQVFIGGNFTIVNNQRRYSVAAVDRGAGTTVSDFRPILSGDVKSLAVSPDFTKVVIGGTFTSANSSNNPGYGLVMVNPQTGASLPTAVNSLIRVAGNYGAINDLYADESGFYGSAFSQNSTQANLEGTFRADWSGNLVWVNDCHGDSYGIYVNDGAAYSAGHAHNCTNMNGFPQTDKWTYHPALAYSTDARGIIGREHDGYFNYEGKPRPEPLVWFPGMTIGTFTGMSQAAWSVAGEDDWVVYGGEFLKVNNTAQQGLVRFAKKSAVPSKVAPIISAEPLRFTPYENGQLNIGWTAATDEDNQRLTYRLYRDGVRVSERIVDSTFYSIPRINGTDSGLQTGVKYTYQLRVSDPDGNVSWMPQVAYTYSPGTANAYDKYILTDNPTEYYRFEETTGTSVSNTARGTTSTAGAQVTKNVDGVNSSRGFRFSGTNYTSTVIPPSSTARELVSNNFSIEAWFKTTSTRGGGILSFGNAYTANSSAMDRVLYLSNTGQVLFGVNPGQVRTVSSPATYRDGQFHHAVGTLSPEGLKLYIDGTLVASRTDTVNARNFTGVWRVGGDSLTGWTSAPTSGYLAADIDSPAVYSYALTAQQVSDHNSAGRTGIVPNSRPTSAFTVAPTAARVVVDGSPSYDNDGSIVSYAWQFGDGSTATGVTATHVYAASGTYTVKLTVTDNLGASTTSQKTVKVVKAPNQAPTASFSTQISALKLTVDGSGSTDPDGVVSTYAWDFGDGSTGTGATAAHSYAAIGTYTVKLTVTDNDGATATATRSVQATPQAVVDNFDRTGANWGSTSPGGTWTYTNGSYFSTDGSAGLIRIPSAGAQGSASLTNVDLADSDTTFTVSLDNPTTGSGVQTTFLTRRNGNSDYRLTLQVHGNQSVRLNLTKRVDNVTTNLGDVIANGVTYTQGDKLHVRFVVSGTGTTTLKGIVWTDGTPEPAIPQISRTDSTPQLQTAGSVGFIAYVGSNATPGPMVIRIHDLTVL